VNRWISKEEEEQICTCSDRSSNEWVQFSFFSFFVTYGVSFIELEMICMWLFIRIVTDHIDNDEWQRTFIYLIFPFSSYSAIFESSGWSSDYASMVQPSWFVSSLSASIPALTTVTFYGWASTSVAGRFFREQFPIEPSLDQSWTMAPVRISRWQPGDLSPAE
jgi:hypothetical protein